MVVSLCHYLPRFDAMTAIAMMAPVATVPPMTQPQGNVLAGAATDDPLEPPVPMRLGVLGPTGASSSSLEKMSVTKSVACSYHFGSSSFFVLELLELLELLEPPELLELLELEAG
tara:strand:+ start:1175 stop:1519 length:345 start_codon:yes stop_codon:yes gene_type:complete